MTHTERKVKATELGRAAFEIGMDKIAANDKGFLLLMEGVPLATADSLETLHAWRRGWGQASLEKQFKDATDGWAARGWRNSDPARDERNIIYKQLELL
jgi:hypothetical protein